MNSLMDITAKSLVTMLCVVAWSLVGYFIWCTMGITLRGLL